HCQAHRMTHTQVNKSLIGVRNCFYDGREKSQTVCKFYGIVLPMREKYDHGVLLATQQRFEISQRRIPKNVNSQRIYSGQQPIRVFYDLMVVLRPNWMKVRDEVAILRFFKSFEKRCASSGDAQGKSTIMRLNYFTCNYVFHSVGSKLSLIFSTRTTSVSPNSSL